MSMVYDIIENYYHDIFKKKPDFLGALGLLWSVTISFSRKHFRCAVSCVLLSPYESLQRTPSIGGEESLPQLDLFIC